VVVFLLIPALFVVRLAAKKAVRGDGFSDAEIEQTVVSALHRAFDTNAKLNDEMIISAIEEIRPLSVTMKERIDALCAWAKERCVPAD